MLLDTSIRYTVGPLLPSPELGKTKRRREQMIATLLLAFLRKHQIALKPQAVVEKGPAFDKRLEVLCTGFLEPVEAYMALHHSIAVDGKPLRAQSPDVTVSALSAIAFCECFGGVATGTEGLAALRMAINHCFFVPQ